MDRRIRSSSPPSRSTNSDGPVTDVRTESTQQASSQVQPLSGSVTPRVHASSTADSTAGLGAGPGLNEFRSLLEAAQRVANGASFGPDEASWPAIETSDLTGAQSTDANRRLRRPLLRQYSGRPHVPGEDSGSEDSDGLEQEQAHSTPQTVRRRRDTLTMDNSASPGPRNASPFRNPVAVLLNASAESDQDVERARLREDAFRAGMRPSARHRASRDISQERHRRRAEIITRLHDPPGRAESSDNASTAVDHLSSTRDSFYDWGPEPETLHSPTSTIDHRSQLSYLRRWRPSERLQDFASSHARRDSLTGNQGQPLPPLEVITPERWRHRNFTHDLSDHNEIVDRVERALQDYRLARRAFRAQQEDTQSSTNSSSLQRPLDSAGLVYRPAEISPTLRNSLSARHARDSTRDPDELQSEPRRSDRDRLSILSTLTDRSTEASRARIREQARERRRRIVGGIADQENGTSVASGPLFDRSEDRFLSYENERARAETRSMLDKVRRAEARAKSKDLQRAKAALQHLARLREPNMTSVKAWTSAAEVGLHNQSLTEAEKKNLPMALEDLPLPAYSSWLEPGMTWQGTQAADDADFQTSRRISYTPTTLSRVWEQHHFTELMTQHADLARVRAQGEQSRAPLERVALTTDDQSTTSDSVESAARNSMQALEEAERNLTTMLERNQRLLRENERQLQENQDRLTRDRERLRAHNETIALMSHGADIIPDPPPRGARQSGDGHDGSATTTHQFKPRDQWNVKVSLHEVDWAKMTVSGTMTATSSMNGILRSDNPDRSPDVPGPTSTESFFTGEIIDFDTYGLDTIAPSPETGRIFHHRSPELSNSQTDFRVGGPDVDLTYWSKLGPFKQAIDDAEKARELELQEAIRKQELEKLLPDTPRAEPSSPNVSNENKAETANDNDSLSLTPTATAYHTTDERLNRQMRTMHNLLTDSAWIRENVNAKGWILMRWKERCFVGSDDDPNPDPIRAIIPARSSIGRGATNNDSALARGWSSFTEFYQRRQNERAANASVMFTTNAAEREEQARRGGSRQLARELAAGGGSDGQAPAWGLTISGFYYVAMHRGSGRIEALYYDCRSAPFQRLSMDVAAGGGAEKNDKVRAGEESRQWTKIEGLKDTFGIVQLR